MFLYYTTGTSYTESTVNQQKSHIWRLANHCICAAKAETIAGSNRDVLKNGSNNDNRKCSRSVLDKETSSPNTYLRLKPSFFNKDGYGAMDSVFGHPKSMKPSMQKDNFKKS